MSTAGIGAELNTAWYFNRKIRFRGTVAFTPYLSCTDIDASDYAINRDWFFEINVPELLSGSTANPAVLANWGAIKVAAI